MTITFDIKITLIIVDQKLLIAWLVNKIGPIKGELCLQKLFAIFQKLGFPINYKFMIGTYGLVSHQLDEDICEIEVLDLIEIEWNQKIPIYKPKSYLSPNRYWHNKLRSLYASEDGLSKFEEYISSFRHFTDKPQKLKLLLDSMLANNLPISISEKQGIFMSTQFNH